MTRRRVVPPIPEDMRVPGYFTELMRRHNWPPGFVCSLDVRPERKSAAPMVTTQERERQSAAGIGWACGTVLMPKTPKYFRPAWMLRSAR